MLLCCSFQNSELKNLGKEKMKSSVVSCLIFIFAVIGLSLASSAPKAEHEKKALCRFTVGEVKGQFIFYLLFSYFPEWLFQHKNFATFAVFGKKCRMATRPKLKLCSTSTPSAAFLLSMDNLCVS